MPLIVSLKFDEEPEYGKKKPKPDEKKPDAKSSETGEASVESKEGAETKDAKKNEKIYEPLKLRKERRRLWEEQVANVIRLHEAGVPFALTARPFKKASEFMESLRLVIEKGLPEEAAIAALTSNAAEVLGMKWQLGAIAPGFVANVTVMTKPLSDKAAKVKFVFIDGKKIDIDADEEKEKAEKDGKGDRPDSEKSTEESATAKSSDTPEVKKDAATPTDVEDKGPIWAVELKVDRIPKTKTGGSVLVKNATVLPVTGPTIPNGSILIRNGKIAAMGSDVPAPPGVTVIDGTGRYVMPGIVDSHSHLGIDGVNEGTLAISAEVRIADTIDPHDVSIYRAIAGGATTHHAMHGSANPIGGQNVIFKLKYERPVAEMVIADAPRTIKFALGENVTQANFFENFGKRYPNTRMGVEATIRMAFEAARDYQREWDDYNRQSAGGQDVPPPRKDLRLEALADVLSGKMTVHSHCYRSEEILRLFAVAEEYGIRIGTLHHVLEGYRIAPELARHGCGASTFANDWAYKVEAYGAIPHNAALMTRHGVTSSVNSDSPNTIRFMNQEAAKCIKWGGLDENQALRLVTLNPAMQLQVDDRIGSLEVGKDGDLAIFNGHPLNTFSKCVMTLIDGEVYFEDPRPDPVEPLTEWKAGPAKTDRTIPTTPHRAYAIVGATVHPISGPVIVKGTVVILEDKILEVGDSATVPPGAGVIDGSGLHVYPGLIDASSILGLNEVDSLRSTRDFSEIGTFNPHLKAASAVHPHSEHIRIARTAGITTALAKPSGGRIYGQSAVIHLDGWTTPDMLVVDAFGLHMNVPSLPIQLPEDKEAKKKQTDEHKKALKQLEDYIAKAKHYAEVKQLAAADPKIRFDVDLTLEAMVPYVRGEKPVIFAVGTYKPILDAIEFAEKHKLKCVLSGGAESWKLADVLKQKDIPVILSTVLSYPWGEYEAWDSVYRCAAELDRAGVKFCFGSESASSAFVLGSMVGMAVAHGLPRERAEYALTLGAAEILG
ncbi:MAG: amidohydrolase family protein, partial [Planctomycetota bacterium]